MSGTKNIFVRRYSLVCSYDRQCSYKGLDLAVKPTAKLYSTVFEDNNRALSIAQSPRMSPRTKHIATKYHHFRNNIGEEKGIVLEKIDTTKEKADILTKGLPSDTHVSIRKLMMGW